MSKFWSSQPVVQNGDNIESVSSIKEIRNVKDTPYMLPMGYKWYNCEINDLSELKELLDNNYIGDVDNIFRLDYSISFLEWCLFPPETNDPDHTQRLGIKNNKNELVGFISAYPASVTIGDKKYKMGIVNFLCVTKTMRNNRIAPVLIKEILRRGHIRGYNTSAYTANKVITKPFCSSKYYYRPLDVKKLVKHNFMEIGKRMTLSRSIKLYSIDMKMKNKFSLLKETHCKSAYRLVCNGLKKYKVHINFALAEFTHWFMPSPKYLYTYVLIDKNEVTDLLSFYVLPSKVIGTDESIMAAYSWYNFCTTISIHDLIHDALVIAKIHEVDVYKTQKYEDNLKFCETDGVLHYYFHNLSCPTLHQNDINLLFH